MTTFVYTFAQIKQLSSVHGRETVTADLNTLPPLDFTKKYGI